MNKKGFNTITSLFVFNSLFWILLIITMGLFGGYFNLSGSNIEVYTDTTTGKQFIDLNEDDLTEGFNILTFGKNITLIFRVMFWFLPNGLNVPLWLPILLHTFSLYSLFIFIMWLRGNS